VNENQMEEGARQIVALVNGNPGPFFEDDTSFFGRKRVNPSMKERKMETDCGGAIITKAPITYGEADAIAAAVDLPSVAAFIRIANGPECYRRTLHDERIWIGDLRWAIYSYLATEKKVPGDPESYNNSMEYLFDAILKRMEQAGLVKSIDDKRRYFSLTS